MKGDWEGNGREEEELRNGKETVREGWSGIGRDMVGRRQGWETEWKGGRWEENARLGREIERLGKDKRMGMIRRRQEWGGRKRGKGKEKGGGREVWKKGGKKKGREKESRVKIAK